MDNSSSSSLDLWDWLATMPPQFLNFVLDKLSTEEITLLLGTRRIWDLDLPNVIRGLDPLSMEPPNSSGEWYLNNSEAPQYPSRGSAITETGSGFWKTKEDCRIFTDTNYVGRKTTMEFYNGKVPNGNRTRWTMHKYQAEKQTSNGFSNKMVYNISLYRVFLQNHQSDYEEHYSSASCECAMELGLSILQEPGKKISPSSDVLNRSLGQSTSSGSLYERLNENVRNNINATRDPSDEDYVELNDFCGSEHTEATVSMGKQRQSVDPEIQGELYSDGDFVELNDICSPEEGQSTFSGSVSEYLNEKNVKDAYLENNFSNAEYLELNDQCSPATSSSSSDNSSRMSIDSSDYFNSGALLSSIRDEGNLGEEERTNYMITVSRAAESNQSVIRLPSPGSAHSNTSIAVEEIAPASSLPENEISHQEFLMSNDNRPNKRDDSKTGKSEANEMDQDTDSMQVRGLKKVANIAKLGKKYLCFGSF